MASTELIEPGPYDPRSPRPLTRRERRVLRKSERRIARAERRQYGVIDLVRDTKTLLDRYDDKHDAHLTEVERRRERVSDNLNAFIYALACTTLVVLMACWASIALS